MNEDDIECLSELVLETFNISSLPIDPLHIAKSEGISLLPGNYDGCFEGRIEFRRRSGAGQFYLFYAEEEQPFRPLGRVRFSISHELGHYFLPDHRRYLLSGKWHNSKSDGYSPLETEREADQFAASLLMPREFFRDEVRARSEFCTLRDLQFLSREVFRTSLTSTILRYVKMNFEPCCFILSEGNNVLYSIASEDLRDWGLGFVRRGSVIPSASVTARAAVSHSAGELGPTEGEIDSTIWFPGRPSRRLWEESLLLTASGRKLTFLAPTERDSDPD